MKYSYCYSTILGELLITEEEGAIIGLGFSAKYKDPELLYQETDLLKQTSLQITEYLSGNRKSFTVPLKTDGTPFQERIWKALKQIPYGETKTYGQLAHAAGSPKGARAAGMACNRNPIMILIPCHRIIGSNGSLTGFGGGLKVKELLLDLEKANQSK